MCTININTLAMDRHVFWQINYLHSSKINSRKLQLIREKSNLDYPYWQVAIKR